MSLHAVALVNFESEIDSKNCSLGWRSTLRRVFKGQDKLVAETQVSIYVLPVKGCNVINFIKGVHYLVSGSLETDGTISVGGKRGEVIWVSIQFAPLLGDIVRCSRG